MISHMMVFGVHKVNIQVMTQVKAEVLEGVVEASSPASGAGCGRPALLGSWRSEGSISWCEKR